MTLRQWATDSTSQNRHIVPMAVIDVVLILAITTLLMASKDVPAPFYDSVIGLSFAIAGVTKLQ